MRKAAGYLGTFVAGGAAMLVWLWVQFFTGIPDPVTPPPNAPRPIDALDTVFLEEMTWMEIRDAVRGGVDTAIVATGGVEQTGPYVATGKHNFILRATTEAIARKLGKTLVAPIVPFVPEGELDPPSFHMKYAGTLSIREEVYRGLLTDLCASLRIHGFRRIVLLGDSTGNQPGLKAVADELNARWKDGKTRLYHIPGYYDYGRVARWLEGEGIRQLPEGLHDNYVVTAMLASIDPKLVRLEQRIKAGKATINGVPLTPVEKTIGWGKRIIDYRADHAVELIRAAFSSNRRSNETRQRSGASPTE